MEDQKEGTFAVEENIAIPVAIPSLVWLIMGHASDNFLFVLGLSVAFIKL